jgi:hypothetical protein
MTRGFSVGNTKTTLAAPSACRAQLCFSSSNHFQISKPVSLPSAYKCVPSSPARNTRHLHGQSLLSSAPTTAATERAREREGGDGHGAQEAPEAAATRPRLRLVAPADAAEEAAAEAGRGEEAVAGGAEAAGAGQVRERGHRESGRWAPAFQVLPASGPGGARLLHPSLSRPLQLVRKLLPASLSLPSISLSLSRCVSA